MHIWWSLDQYYGESEIPYNFKKMSIQVITNIDDYITHRSTACMIDTTPLFKNYDEFNNNAGRIYEYYTVRYSELDIHEDLGYPEDYEEDDSYEEIKSEWLYIVAVYSHMW